jgi:hypothetical protein
VVDDQRKLVIWTPNEQVCWFGCGPLGCSVGRIGEGGIGPSGCNLKSNCQMGYKKISKSSEGVECARICNDKGTGSK